MTNWCIMVAHRGKFVAYYRVSTDRQGKSGLGLDAQRAAVKNRLDGGGWRLIGEFTEVESGKRVNRPKLLEALALCKKEKAKLVVAKLDRLTRNVKFMLTLLDSNVELLFCDMPEVAGAMGRFILTGMANVAQLEAGLISERTKAGLAIARQRGVKLGRTGAKILAPKFRAEAMARAKRLAPLLRDFQERNYSLREIARELTKRKIETPRGGEWHPQLVQRVMQRAGLAS